MSHLNELTPQPTTSPVIPGSPWFPSAPGSPETPFCPGGPMLIGAEFPGSPLVPGKPGGPRDPGRPGTAKPQRQKKKQSLENCASHDFHLLPRNISSAAVAAGKKYSFWCC